MWLYTAITNLIRINFFDKTMKNNAFILNSKGYIMLGVNNNPLYQPYCDTYNRGFFLNNPDFIEIFDANIELDK